MNCRQDIEVKLDQLVCPFCSGLNIGVVRQVLIPSKKVGYSAVEIVYHCVSCKHDWKKRCPFK